MRIIAFDLDDTLAPSKSPIDENVSRLLVKLLGKTRVCIISGGRFEQFDTQVLKRMAAPDDLLERLHLMPTCGTRYFRFVDGEWVRVYSEDLSAEEKADVVAVLISGAKELGLWEEHPYGEIIEDRGSQITFSALGQQAPVERKSAWDPGGVRRERLRAYAAERLPDLEVRSGGSTSIDVTRKGVDKAYGMRKLMEQLGVGIDDLLFIGDRLDEGGNDFPVRQLGIECVQVSTWHDTVKYVEMLLAEPDSAQLPIMPALPRVG